MDQANVRDAHTARQSLSGRRVAITGGTTGIGRATAVLLASEGARLFICGRDPRHLDDALERIGQVGEGDGIAIDLAERGSVDRFFEQACEYLGGLDVAIINAAVPVDGLTDVGELELRYAIATDFTAYVMAAYAAQKRMKSGDMVLVGSLSAHSLKPGSTVYAGIKAGIAAFAEALRKELGSEGIKVSLIEPGFTGADFHYPRIGHEEQAELINAQKMLRAEDIAVGIHYLLTQPDRTVVQQLAIVPRVEAE